MIKLQDFASQCGVTDRQIHRLLKKYESELVGHYERRGVNGTWFDEEACSIIKSKMRVKEIIIGNDNEIAELKNQIQSLQDELIMKNQALINSQNKVLQLEEKRDKDIKSAEDKLKLEMESKYQEEIRKLKEHLKENEGIYQLQLKEERNRSLTIGEAFSRIFKKNNTKGLE